MSLTPKQREFFNTFFPALERGKNIFLLAGGAGSGKSFTCLLLLHKMALDFPGSRFGVFRKSVTTLKTTTIPSFRKVLSATKTSKSLSLKGEHALYRCGSEIVFSWADTSKDPDCNNIKGLELSAALFEEVNQIDRKFFYTAFSRVGRWKSQFPPFLLANCNPNMSWVKSEFYDKYISGSLPENVYLQESIPKDNPHLSNEYIQTLEALPESERQRFLLNIWDYDANPSQLIPREAYARCVKSELTIDAGADAVLGIDPADEGKDSTVLCIMQGECVISIEVFPSLNEVKAAHLAKLRMEEHSIPPTNVIIDSVGIGAGCLNTLREEGLAVNSFVGGEAPGRVLDFYSFKNLRAEAGWLLRESFCKGNISLLQNIRLENEINSITYSIDDDKTLRLSPKKDIKKRLGHSPDIFDALMMANYLRVTNMAKPLNILTSKPNRLSKSLQYF